MRRSKGVWSLRARALKLSCLLLTFVMTGSGSALAFEPILGQGEGLADNVILSNPSASMLTRVPSGGLRKGGWLIESGYARQYNLSEFDQFFFAGALRRGRFILAGELQSFGQADLYSELTGQFMLSYSFDSLVIGGSVSGRVLQFGYGYEKLRAVGIGFGLSYRMKQYLFSFTGDNLNSPTYYDGRWPLEAVYSVYGEYRGQASYSILAHLKMEAQKKTRIGFGQRLIVAKNGAIVWGIETEPFKYGAGFEMKLPGGRLTYSFSLHPVLGFSHVVSISTGNVVGKRGGSDDFK